MTSLDQSAKVPARLSETSAVGLLGPERLPELTRVIVVAFSAWKRVGNTNSDRVLRPCVGDFRENFVMTALLPEIFAGGFDRYDGTIQFYQRVNALLRPDFVVVDIGAGRGRIRIDDPIAYRRRLTSLKGKVKSSASMSTAP
jgi:hypothetical protein